MTRHHLTLLQRGVLERMRFRGLNTLAGIARAKWLNGERCKISLKDHPRLEAEFNRANDQAGESFADAR